jgi:hypothetical protein
MCAYWGGRRPGWTCEKLPLKRAYRLLSVSESRGQLKEKKRTQTMAILRHFLEAVMSV